MIDFEELKLGRVEIVHAEKFMRYDPGHIAILPFSIVEPFYQDCKDKLIGNLEAIVVALRNEKGWLVVGKTIKTIDNVVHVCHYNYHPLRKQMQLTHTTVHANKTSPWNHISNQFNITIDLLEKGIPDTFKTLNRLFEVTKNDEAIPAPP